MMQAQIVVDRFLRQEHSHAFMLNAYERLLLVMLASYMGNKTSCFPSHQSLSIDCGMSTDSVKRTLKSLENKYLIKILRTTGSSNHYQLTIPSADSTGCSQPPVANSTIHLVASAGTPGANSPPNNISNNIKQYTLLANKKLRVKTIKKTFPQKFAINESHREKANGLSLDIDSEFEHFKEHHIAKGSKFSDWGMAFHTWLRNAAKFSQQKKSFDTTNIMSGVGRE
ncbi:hypothetical protein DGG96_08980 [Legionella qingyii]|uniref:Helix-turn-helix domain-containing protein n=1 Tax=Legionella qingyii TaxID=2184757 RepID=A0A317U3V6_9GAMM|nr:helix-turn-helix domain-containing protein [Legionella qingyii]PWY56059.1 hypothetical protein DGG96_08980 [Legionella qingyii]RUR22062.1 helix-turn-helix domain-containing protein [Legionella qingyii]RUR25642.1 helix-turn-helix domain-containing protein [Legionella qingyii]